MFLVVAGFLAVTALLESDGLASWANRLDPGPMRSVAAPATAMLVKSLEPLGLSTIRKQALLNLARVGWTDDPALLAKAETPARTMDARTVAACNAPALMTGKVEAATPANLAKAPVARPLLAVDVPGTMQLASLPQLEPGRPRVVALTGDSMMAVGMSAMLLREAAGDKNLRMVKAFRSGTGLARPEVFNWMDEYPAMLGNEKPDVVIVAIGANDGQGFVVDGKVLAYGSEAWRNVYQARINDFLAMVSADGARVVWVGLPPMREPGYNVRIAAINHLAYTVVSKFPQATWWNPTSYVGDGAGNFREFVTLRNGATLRIRAVDGVHLSDEGAGMLTTVLMKWLDPPAPQVKVFAHAEPAPAAKTKAGSKSHRLPNQTGGS